MKGPYPGAGAPWADFLHARARLIKEWADDGKTPEAIARQLNKHDPGQVRLILMTVDDHPEEYGNPFARKAT